MSEKPSIDSIFCTAVEIESTEEREAYLERVCGDDPELRQQVDRLLDAHFQGGSILDSPPHGLGVTVDQPITEKPGTQIGPYKLLQQVGEGGMGVVYMAEQKEPVKRRVALKIIKPGMETRQVIARFEAERQALAMMDHPNIAKVLDAGQTDSGRPYFVMELVKGIPLTQYCDEQHLNPRERLELFVPICQAVQHAHQKGIIHRDIKPSNILVALFDGHPVPKVIDFGVAKATNQTLTEKTMFTQLGQVVGTLEYMSPEQAQVNQLDVDTRSDIYSLGVLLYELLTGDTPFDRTRLRSAAFDEMLRIIREEEPPKPSTKISSSASLPSIAANRHVDPHRLTSAVRGELDWIVMKALEKDRARRYETASKFTEDVQHYLNDEPVVACPPSAAYRFRKFARRYQAGIVTTAAIAAALIIGSGVAIWQAHAATKERDRAVIAEGNAEQQAERAEQAANEARAAAARERQATQRERTTRLAAQRNLYLANVNLVQQAYEAGNGRRVLDLLAASVPSSDGAPDEDVRGVEWHYWWWRTHRFQDKLTVNGANTVSPDGKLIAATEDSGESEDNRFRVSLYDAGTGERKHSFPLERMARWPTFSSDSRILACLGYPDRIFLFDTIALEPLATIDLRETGRSFGRPVGAWNVSISHDNRLISFIPHWYADEPLEIPVWKVQGGEAHAVIRTQRDMRMTSNDGTVDIAFSPTESLLATCGSEQGRAVVNFWDPDTGRHVRTVHDDTRIFRRIQFSRDGKRLLTSAYLGDSVEFWRFVSARGMKSNWRHTIWDVATGDSVETLSFAGHVDDVTPDLASAAGISKEGRIDIQDVDGSRIIASAVGHPGRIRRAIFTQDGSALVSIGDDQVCFWDISTNRLARDHFQVGGGHAVSSKTPAFSADGQVLFYVRRDGTLGAFDPTSGMMRATIHSDYLGGHTAVACAPQVQTVATSGRDPDTGHYRIDLRDHSTGKSRLLGNHSRKLLTLRFSPDGRLLASIDAGSTFKVWDIESAECILTNSSEDNAAKGSNSGFDRSLCFSPDSRFMAVSTDVQDERWPGFIELWDLTSRQRRHRWRSTYRPVCCFAPDGRRIAISSSGGDTEKIQIASTNTGTIEATFDSRFDQIYDLAISPDGKTLVCSEQRVNDNTNRLIFWDFATGAQTLTVSAGSERMALAFSADGRMLAAGDRLYRMATPEELKQGRVQHLAVTAYELGDMCRSRHQWTKAAAHYTEALTKDPQNAWALWHRADCYCQTNDVDLALSDFTRAIDIWEQTKCDLPRINDPTELRNAVLLEAEPKQRLEARRLLVRWHAIKHRYRQAARKFEQDSPEKATPRKVAWERQDVDYALSVTSLAHELRVQENPAAAIPFFEQALDVCPPTSNWKFLQLGDRQRRGLQRKLLSIRIELALCHQSLGQDAEYEKQSKVVIASYPSPDQRSVADWGHLSQDLYQFGRYEQARDGLEKTIKLRGDNGPTLKLGPRWWYYTLTLCHLGETQQARAHYEQLSQLMKNKPPMSPKVHHELRMQAAKLLGLKPEKP